MTEYGYLLPTRGAVMESDSPADLIDRMRDEVVGLAVEAESVGFDAVWIGDSVLAKPRPEPLTTLSSVATATDSVTLGTSVYLPTLRHPINVAHQAVTLDVLSDGRLALGMGVGRGPAVEQEYETLDLDYGRRGRLLDESLDVIHGLFEGDTVSADGEFFEFGEATLGFRPERAPPIYIPYRTIGEEGTFPRHVRERIVDHGAGWIPTAIGPETYRAGVDSLERILADAGRSMDAFDLLLYLNVVVEETTEEATDRARTFLETYYPRLNDLSDEEVHSYGAFGTPSAVAEALDRFREAGVEQFAVRFTHPDQSGQLDRFTDLVG